MAYRPVARQLLRNKQRDNGRYYAAIRAKQWKYCWRRSFLCGPLQGYNTLPKVSCIHPCGGRVEYLHRDTASRRRRRRGKSQIWDSKIWLRMPRDSDPRKTTLARTSSVYKKQTRPLVREGPPQKQYRNCQRIINIWSWGPNGARHQDVLVDWPSIAMWLWLWLDFELVHCSEGKWRVGRRVTKLVREHQFSHCELLLSEGSIWGMGIVREPRVCRWKPLPGNDWWRHCWLKRLSTCYSELRSLWISNSAIVTCNYDL
jgi:hypothetical protein